ncbi:hypothetical protein [Kordia sp.]|uniref:hypothetical protein n=1 Tax=Kordia sp. TaxID=1965332 RepID=UPI0025C50C86|nr:hypothetical protein [Kordia sp.]MCH2192638.1 hypothetical protein [Kordia sp.]
MRKEYRFSVQGTPYYDENFNYATIIPINRILMVRYNVALDIMEVIKKRDTLFMNKKNKNYIVKLNKGNVVYKILEHVESASKDKLGYYVQLTTGEKSKTIQKR